jgi:hypothetical protein
MCYMAVFLKFMLVLHEMGITETIGHTEHVKKMFMQILLVYIEDIFFAISNYLALEFVHYLLLITDTSCGGKLTF